MTRNTTNRERMPIYRGRTYEEALRVHVERMGLSMQEFNLSDSDPEGDELLERSDESALEYGMNHHRRIRK